MQRRSDQVLGEKQDAARSSTGISHRSACPVAVSSLRAPRTDLKITRSNASSMGNAVASRSSYEINPLTPKRAGNARAGSKDTPRSLHTTSIPCDASHRLSPPPRSPIANALRGLRISMCRCHSGIARDQLRTSDPMAAATRASSAYRPRSVSPALRGTSPAVCDLIRAAKLRRRDGDRRIVLSQRGPRRCGPIVIRRRIEFRHGWKGSAWTCLSACAGWARERGRGGAIGSLRESLSADTDPADLAGRVADDQRVRWHVMGDDDEDVRDR